MAVLHSRIHPEWPTFPSNLYNLCSSIHVLFRSIHNNPLSQPWIKERKQKCYQAQSKLWHAWPLILFSNLVLVLLFLSVLTCDEDCLAFHRQGGFGGGPRKVQPAGHTEDQSCQYSRHAQGTQSLHQQSGTQPCHHWGHGTDMECQKLLHRSTNNDGHYSDVNPERHCTVFHCTRGENALYSLTASFLFLFLSLILTLAPFPLFLSPCLFVTVSFSSGITLTNEQPCACSVPYNLKLTHISHVPTQSRRVRASEQIRLTVCVYI